jgi:hypothetical protein
VAFTAAGSGQSGTIRSPGSLDVGKWHHVIAEADRKARSLTLYVDGKQVAQGSGVDGEASLATSAPVYVGGTPRGENLAATLEFLRICQGTLAEAKTTIDELYAWQFEGPQHRDFMGNAPTGAGRDAGAIEHTGN